MEENKSDSNKFIELKPLTGHPSTVFMDFMSALTRSVQGRPLADIQRDLERKIINSQWGPVVDLRTVPRDQWDNYVDHDVTLPTEITTWLEKFRAGERSIVGRQPGPNSLTQFEIHKIEEIVERHHGITAPYYVAMSLTLQHTGRSWIHEPEAAKFLTGLTLGKE